MRVNRPQTEPTTVCFGTLLAVVRVLRQVSQRDVARVSGLPVSSISLIENGIWHPTDRELLMYMRTLSILPTGTLGVHGRRGRGRRRRRLTR
jgi:hypothetical protein